MVRLEASTVAVNRRVPITSAWPARGRPGRRPDPGAASRPRRAGQPRRPGRRGCPARRGRLAAPGSGRLPGLPLAGQALVIGTRRLPATVLASNLTIPESVNLYEALICTYY